MTSATWTELRYAGAKTCKPEKNRLPGAVYEALSEDQTYVRLAELRWLAYRRAEDLDDDPTVPDEIADAIFGAADSDFDSIRAAADLYVAEWLDQHAQALVEDGIEPATVVEAADLYGVVDMVRNNVEEVA